MSRELVLPTPGASSSRCLLPQNFEDTRTPINKAQITWIGTITKDKIVGIYEAIVEGFFY